MGTANIEECEKYSLIDCTAFIDNQISGIVENSVKVVIFEQVASV